MAVATTRAAVTAAAAVAEVAKDGTAMAVAKAVRHRRRPPKCETEGKGAAAEGAGSLA